MRRPCQRIAIGPDERGAVVLRHDPKDVWAGSLRGIGREREHGEKRKQDGEANVHAKVQDFQFGRRYHFFLARHLALTTNRRGQEASIVRDDSTRPGWRIMVYPTLSKSACR